MFLSVYKYGTHYKQSIEFHRNFIRSTVEMRTMDNDVVVDVVAVVVARRQQQQWLDEY